MSAVEASAGPTFYRFSSLSVALAAPPAQEPKPAALHSICKPFTLLPLSFHHASIPTSILDLHLQRPGKSIEQSHSHSASSANPTLTMWPVSTTHGPCAPKAPALICYHSSPYSCSAACLDSSSAIFAFFRDASANPHLRQFASV